MLLFARLCTRRLTIHSSRNRFAVRLNSGVRPHKNMRLLARVHDESRLSEITSLMRAKGIPVFVRSAGPPRGLPKWIVFVCLNEQANDARQLLQNPEHEPKLSVN